MELRVEEVQVPEKIGFNYEELKTQLTTRCEDYKTIVYTPDTIKEAKADRAMLNKLKDSLNAERIRRQKEYMRPFETFKNQIDDLVGIINRASVAIDQQVKVFEEDQKRQKAEDIEVIFEETDFPEFVKLEQIQNPKWMNKTVTLKSIRQEMEDRLNQIGNELASIDSTFPDDTDAAALGRRAAHEAYEKSLDLSQAMYEGGRTLKMVRDEEERKKRAEEAARAAAEKLETDRQEPAQAVENTETPENDIPPAQENHEEKSEATHERMQRVIVEIVAKESQFKALNNLFRELKNMKVEFHKIKKEEL
ncbi:MAG: DUF1351 domain-containing protein [Bilifractor sp.]|jgi:hypothetical protein